MKASLDQNHSDHNSGHDQDADTQVLTSLRDYLKIVFRQKYIIGTTILVVLSATYTSLALKTPKYEARVKMLISAEKLIQTPFYRDLVGGVRNNEEAITQSEIVKSAPVLERVVRLLALEHRFENDEMLHASPLKRWVLQVKRQRKQADRSRHTPEQQRVVTLQKAIRNLGDRIEVIPIRATNLFTISVQDYDPGAAAIIANAVSRSYIIYDLEQQLADISMKYSDKHPLVLQLNESIAAVTRMLDGNPVSNIEAIGPAAVKVIEQANIPILPQGISKKMIMLLSLVLGGMLGITFGFIFEVLDPTFRSVQEVRDQTNLRLLGTLPKSKWGKSRLIQGKERKGRYLHFYQTLADQFYLLVKENKIKTIMTTALSSSEGTSAILANLGILLSRNAGRRVLIIDANFRRPCLHTALKLDNIQGFADLLEGKASLSSVTHPIGERLYGITAGRLETNPVHLLDNGRADRILAEAKKKYEIIIVDCPTLNGYQDASVLARFTETTVVVVSEGKNRRQVVKAALRPLIETRTNILGVIVNNRDFPIPRIFYEWT